MTLIQLATRYYGHAYFWVYIYDYNKAKIKDFDHIPTGTVIRLPKPAQYNIDAANKASVERARSKQAELTKWQKWDDYR